MQISIETLIKAGMDATNVTRLAQMSGTAAEAALKEVSRLAIEQIREMSEANPSLDLNKPQYHVLTLSGQIIGLRDLPRLITEAEQWLRKQQTRDGAL